MNIFDIFVALNIAECQELITGKLGQCLLSLAFQSLLTLVWFPEGIKDSQVVLSHKEFHPHRIVSWLVGSFGLVWFSSLAGSVSWGMLIVSTWAYSRNLGADGGCWEPPTCLSPQQHLPSVSSGLVSTVGCLLGYMAVICLKYQIGSLLMVNGQKSGAQRAGKTFSHQVGWFVKTMHGYFLCWDLQVITPGKKKQKSFKPWNGENRRYKPSDLFWWPRYVSCFNFSSDFCHGAPLSSLFRTELVCFSAVCSLNIAFWLAWKFYL